MYKIFLLLFISFNSFSQTQDQIYQGVEMGKESIGEDLSEPRTQNSLVLRKYDEKAFLKAQEENKKIVLIFSKGNCPNCNLQVPTLKKVLQEKEFLDVEVFQIAYFDEPALLKKYNVSGWTYLIGYKGKTEKKRVQGLIRPSQLRIFLRFMK